MKKLLLILFTIVSVSVQAQYLKPNNSYGLTLNRLNPDSTLFIPTGCGDPSLRGVDLKKVALYADTCNNLLYKYNPVTTTWSVIGSNTTLTDGRVSGGVVTWSGQGLKFYVGPAVYIIGGKYYYSALDSVTLAAAPASNSRIDLIGVDTSRHAFVDTGVVSATPIVPQAQVGVQIPLTTGILINSGDTIPVNAIITNVYNENLGEPNEWSTHTENAPITADFNNTVNPKKGTKDVFISRYNSQSIVYFATSTPYTLSSDAVLSGWIFLNKRLVNTIYAFLYNSTTGAKTNAIPLSLDRFDSTSYQQFVLPTSNFTWTGNTNNQFNTIEFYFSGNDTTDLKGLRMDWLTLQKGIQSVPPQIDYSNKLDSVFLSNDSLFQYVKGVKLFRGLATGSSGSDSSAYSSATSVNDSTWSLNAKNGTKTFFQLTQGTTGIVGDTVKFTNPNFVKKSDKFPIGTIKPILALNDTTLAFDSLNLTEIRYSLINRNIHTDSSLTDKKYVDSSANTKQNTITLTTTGTSGAATLSGSTLNIPQYTSGGGSATTVTEQKNYYHNELYLYQAINTSTGAFSIDSTKGVSDLLPITGGESITIVDSTSSVTIYGWTYDSTFTGISEIRSNALIGTTLNTYTFTAPSNARYLCIYVRYGGVDYSKQISIKSTNTITYNVPIMPENYTGTDRQKIQQALNFQRFVSSPVICYGSYFTDSALMVSSGTKLINYGKIQLARGAKDNIIRNEAVWNRRFPRGNRDILITGTGIFNGTEDGWGGYPAAGVDGKNWKAIGILLANVQNFTVSNLTIRNTNFWTINLEQSRMGVLTGLTLSQNSQVPNMDGINVRRGSNRININNIKGYAGDDFIALTNIKGYTDLNVLDSTIYEPYKTDFDIYGVNIDNIQRDSVGPLASPIEKSDIDLLAQDGLKIHDVSIKNITGYQPIYVGYAAYYRDSQKGIDDMYNIQVNNTGKARIILNYPIKNSSFLNVAKTDVFGNTSCVFPTGTINTERRYYGSYPEYFEANGQNGLIHLDTLGNLPLSPTRVVLGGTDDGYHRLQVFNGARIDSLFGNTSANRLVLMSSVTPTGGTVFMQPSGGKFVFGTSTTSGNNFLVTAEADADGIAINGSSSISPAIQLQVSGAVQGYLGAASAAAKLIPNAASGDVILRSASGQVLLGVGYNNATVAVKNGLVGINTYSPTTALTTTAFATAYATKSGNYTLAAADHTIEVTTSSSTTQTLPTAVGITGREYLITNSGTGTVTIATTSSQTFVNVTGTPTTLTVAQFTSYLLISNGANWTAYKIIN